MEDKIALTLLTWNVNKSFPRGVSQKGSAKRRDILIPCVLEYLGGWQRPDVVLIQESTMQKGTARKRWELSANYRQQRERKGLYQGIDITPDDIDEIDEIDEIDKIDEIDEKDMDSLSDQKDSLVPKGATDHGDALEQADRRAGFADDIIVSDSNDRRLMRSDIPYRAFARKLEVTQNGTKATIIVVSFHSIYKGNRRRYIRLFFNLMCRLAHVHKCPVLIGGDFNLPVGDWRRDIEQEFGSRVRVAEIYPPTPRRRRDNIIDTFAVVHPQGGRVTCTLSKPVAVYPFPDIVSDDCDDFEVVDFSNSDKDKIKRLLPTHRDMPDWKILRYDLDHDPVLMNVTLELESSSEYADSDTDTDFTTLY